MKKVKKLSLGFKTVISILIMVVLLSAIEGSIAKIIFDRTINSEYEKNVTNLAETVSVAITRNTALRLKEKVADVFAASYNADAGEMDEAEYEAYMSNFAGLLEDPDYKELTYQLDTIRVKNDVESVYLIYVDPDVLKTIYIADGSDDPCLPGDFDALYESNMFILDDPDLGFPAYITNTPEYGWLVSAGAPIYDDEGNVFAYSFVDISMNDVKAIASSFAAILLVTTIVIVLIFSFIYIQFIRRTVVKPINSLSDAALSYTESENKNVFEKLKIHTGDEIENLSDAMKQMEKDIDKYINDITSITAEKERIGAELNVATQIQADMLPRIFPPFPDIDAFDLYASMDPAKEVGGDFYDFFMVDNDHLGLVVADVSGKGVPAALFMVIAKTLIKNRALTGGTPSEILSYANEQLCEGNEAELFVTVWLAILDIRTGKGVAANAGHEHPALRRADGSFELVMYKHSPAVATMEGMRFREHEFELHPGDTLMCYTDGVTEATNKNNELFGNDRLLAALNKDPDADVENIIRNVKDDIDAFVGEAPQFDDITMLCLKYKAE
ncbi:MAG: HAMP domain-containing protein [Butyrivibrio sp.]|nr:HAMP domain-containing protein [Butyrivibrio sp.]